MTDKQIIEEYIEVLENVYEACVHRKDMDNPNKVLDWIENIVGKARDKLFEMTKKEEMDLILKIVDRGYSTMKEHYKTKLGMVLDIEKTHELRPLNLNKLLKEDDSNFYHELFSILNNMDRKTWQFKT